MPAKSAKQRRYLMAKFGKAWAKKHHFNRVKHTTPRTKRGK